MQLKGDSRHFDASFSSFFVAGHSFMSAHYFHAVVERAIEKQKVVLTPRDFGVSHIGLYAALVSDRN